MSVPTSPSCPSAFGAACGKVILIGEHAVVHGYPAIATPLCAVEARVTARRSPGLLRIETEQAGVDTRGLVKVATAVLLRYGHEAAGVTLHVQANIPAQAGLGSSAATSIAVVRALAAAYDLTVTPEELLELADIGEQAAHGRASGVDVTASLAKGVVRFVRGMPPTRIPLQSPMWLIVGDSGMPRNTHQAVAAVAKQPDALRESAFNRIADATQQLEEKLRAGNLQAAGVALNVAHHALSTLGLSTPALDTLCQAATQAGAFGAKLTGAGCGGCVVSLCADEPSARKVETALRRAGAVRTFSERLTP